MAGFRSNYQSGTAVADRGSDTYNDTNAHTGKWSALLVLEAATLSSITDNGASPSTVLTGTAYPAGTYIGANGDFIAVQMSSAGMIQMIRA